MNTLRFMRQCALALLTLPFLATVASAEDCPDGVATLVGGMWQLDTTIFPAYLAEESGINAEHCVSIEIRDAGDWANRMAGLMRAPDVDFVGGLSGLAALLSSASSDNADAYQGSLPVIAASYANSTFTLIGRSDITSAADLLGQIIATGRCGDHWNAPGSPSGAGAPNVGTHMIVSYVRAELGPDVPIVCAEEGILEAELRDDTIYIHDGPGSSGRIRGLQDGTYAAAAVLVEAQFSAMAKEPGAYQTLIAPGETVTLPASGIFVRRDVWETRQDDICRMVRAIQETQNRFIGDEDWAWEQFNRMVDYNPDLNYIHSKIALTNDNGSPNIEARTAAIATLYDIARNDLLYPTVAPSQESIDQLYSWYNISEAVMPKSEIYVGDACFN